MTTSYLKAAAVAALLLTGAEAVEAQGFPTRPVRVILPLSAGGLGDVVARAMSQELTKRLGQAFFVENHPGANTMIGARECSRATADGHTLCVLAVDTLTYGPYLYKNAGIDPQKSFQPITNLFFLTEVMVVNPSLPVHTLAELVDYSKSNPGKLSYATPANGVRIFMERFKRDTGADIVAVPYKGGGDAVNAVVAGQTQVGYFGMGNSIGNIQSGKMRALAIDSPQRSPLFPDVPTLSESGYKERRAGAWFGVFAPAGTPRPIVDRLHAEIVDIVRAPDFLQKFIIGIGLEPVLNTPDEFARFLQDDRAAAKPDVEASGLQPE